MHYFINYSLMKKFSHKFLNSIWYEGLRPPIILRMLSIIFRFIVYLRKTLYEAGFLRVIDIGIPVIIVGNISIGGTGKTPVTLWLSEELRKKNQKVGIISRGYKGKNKRQEPIIINSDHSAAEYGDEAVYLAQESNAMICVCTNKVKAAKLLKEKGVDIIISDDGLQHYALGRDIEILIIDSNRLFGNALMLPAGPLREDIERIASVDLIMVNGSKILTKDEPLLTNNPIEYFTIENEEVREVNSNQIRSIIDFADTEVQVLAGIGNPERIYSELKKKGLHIIPIMAEDHELIDLDTIEKEATIPIFITPKDYVKYQGKMRDNTWLLNPKIRIKEGLMIDSILNKLIGRNL